MDELATAISGYDVARASFDAACDRLCLATGAYVVARVGSDWHIVASTAGASATRRRRPGRGATYALTLHWSRGGGGAWAAWAEYVGHSPRLTPETPVARAATPAGALLALADLTDGMAARGRLPRRVADLRHLAQYCRDLAAECPGEGA